jgi:hypothetical protein
MYVCMYVCMYAMGPLRYMYNGSDDIGRYRSDNASN